jgi:16S rRNA (cytidine1402-2'-O)-methyltransferase
MESLEKGLYIVATPIGNLNDLSTRAENILNLVDCIICENPKHSLKLLNKLGIKKKLLSLHDYNEKNLIKRIEKYQKSTAIALISDAGSPLISDPGYNLVLDYIEKKIMITTIPGPSSIISALQLSGLPINNFKFFGFVSKNKSSIDSLIQEIKCLSSTSILFISGIRLINFLQRLLDKKIIKRISVCNEITKKNEMVFRGSVENVINSIQLNKKSIKGEFVIIIEGQENKAKKKLDHESEKQLKKLLVKFSLTEAVEIVHKLSNISKREVYKTALLIKND